MKEKNERGKTLLWTVRFCFKLSRTYFILWSLLSIAVAILPAVVLYFQKESVSILSGYLLTGQGELADVLPAVVGLGIFLAAMGVASRFNYGYIWLVLYNKYFLGTEERVMETIRDISRKTFLEQKFKEDYYFAIARCGAVTEIISTLFILFSKALSILSVSLVVLRYSWQLVLVTMLYLLLVVLINRYLGNKVKDRTADIKLADQRSGYFMDMVMNTGVAKEIRLFGASDRIVAKWEKEYNQVKNFEKGNDQIYAWLSLTSKLVYFLFISAVLGFAVRQVLAGRMELGIFTAVYAMGQTVSGSIQEVVLNYSTLLESLYVVWHQMNFFEGNWEKRPDVEIHSVKSDIRKTEEQEIEKRQKNEKKQVGKNQSGKEKSDYVFEADHISFSYDDKKEVLSDISFGIRQGESVALVGCNGSGKSTLIRLLTKMFAPTGGTLRFQGKDYRSIPTEELTKEIGIFFQDSALLHVTLRENIGYGSKEDMGDNAQIQRAVRMGGAESLVEKLPEGLSTLLMKRVDKSGVILSGGEAQKVAIARAYMGERDILIFDEPSAALDPIAERELFERIRQENQGKTVIMISHRVAFARMADRILVLNDGHLEEEGNHEELMKRKGLYAEFYQEQAKWYEQESA